ncbi:hypothetical protein RRG08_049172 [Elysia crispata]|uniref:Uncharacterized protein n=1 Tax=Elysia crispata TaxID=231223 RepID=A0AAE1ARA0_9GAST|nr:hypothetical protein RRG08_049172 [Elysia crispata]
MIKISNALNQYWVELNEKNSSEDGMKARSKLSLVSVGVTSSRASWNRTKLIPATHAPSLSSIRDLQDAISRVCTLSGCLISISHIEMWLQLSRHVTIIKKRVVFVRNLYLSEDQIHGLWMASPCQMVEICGGLSLQTQDNQSYWARDVDEDGAGKTLLPPSGFHPAPDQRQHVRNFSRC